MESVGGGGWRNQDWTLDLGLRYEEYVLFGRHGIIN